MIHTLKLAMELHQSLTLQTLITLFLSLYILKTILKRKRETISRPKPPPKVPGGWPLVGHLGLFSGPELPHVALSNLADKYGPIFTIQLGMKQAVVISDRDIAKECFTKQNDIIFSNRPKTQAIDYMCYGSAMFGFAEHGRYWRELQKITTTILFSNRAVEKLADAREIEVGATMKTLYRTCGGNNHSENVVVEMKKVFEELTLNFSMRIVFGGVEDEMKAKLSDAIRELFRGSSARILSDVIPIMKWFDHFGGMKKLFKETGKKMDTALQSILDEHKQHGDDNRRSFMRDMMDVADRLSREFPEYDADTITKATCETMILGGTETMAATLTWTLCLLLNNRRSLKRAQQELGSLIGRERLVKESDMKNLVYLRAVLNEKPILPPRFSSEDTTVAGYHVPSGTQLIINLDKVQKDPQVWSEPLQFKPERFLDERQPADVRGRDFDLFPFGAGRKICPAASFAMQLMEFTLANLLHGFEIDTMPSDEPVDMTGTSGTPTVKATPLEVVLKPRLSPSVYVI